MVSILNESASSFDHFGLLDLLQAASGAVDLPTLGGRISDATLRQQFGDAVSLDARQQLMTMEGIARDALTLIDVENLQGNPYGVWADQLSSQLISLAELAAGVEAPTLLQLDEQATALREVLSSLVAFAPDVLSVLPSSAAGLVSPAELPNHQQVDLFSLLADGVLSDSDRSHRVGTTEDIAHTINTAMESGLSDSQLLEYFEAAVIGIEQGLYSPEHFVAALNNALASQPLESQRIRLRQSVDAATAGDLAGLAAQVSDTAVRSEFVSRFAVPELGELLDAARAVQQSISDTSSLSDWNSELLAYLGTLEQQALNAFVSQNYADNGGLTSGRIVAELSEDLQRLAQSIEAHDEGWIAPDQAQFLLDRDVPVPASDDVAIYDRLAVKQPASERTRATGTREDMVNALQALVNSRDADAVQALAAVFDDIKSGAISSNEFIEALITTANSSESITEFAAFADFLVTANGGSVANGDDLAAIANILEQGSSTRAAFEGLFVPDANVYNRSNNNNTDTVTPGDQYTEITLRYVDKDGAEVDYDRVGVYVSESYAQDHTQAEINAAVDYQATILQAILDENLTRLDPRLSGQSEFINDLVVRLLIDDIPAGHPQLRPATLGELAMHSDLPTVGVPDEPVNPEIRLVIYLDDQGVRPGGELSVYRAGEAEGKSSIGVLHVNADASIAGNYGQYFSNLGQSALATQSYTDSAAFKASIDTYIVGVNTQLGVPDFLTPAASLQVEDPNRIGAEHEYVNVSLQDSNGLFRKTRLAITQDSDFGDLPILRLEVEQQTSTSPHIPELISAPLTLQQRLEPEYTTAIMVFDQVLESFGPEGGARSTVSLEQIVGRYNERLIGLLGNTASQPYQLNLTEAGRTVSATLSRNPSDQSESPPQPTVVSPYTVLNNEVLSDIYDDETVRDGARSKRPFGSSRDAAESVVSSINESLPLGERVSPELQAFITHVIANSLRSAIQGEDKFYQEILFRISPEDALFGILSDADVAQLNAWYSREENQAFFYEAFVSAYQENIVSSRRPLSDEQVLELARRNFRNTLEKGLALRLQYGGGQLDASSAGRREHSYVPGGGYELIRHTHSSPESRRPIIKTPDGTAYIGIEHRIWEEFSELTDALRTAEGLVSHRDELAGLFAHIPEVDNYTRLAITVHTQLISTLSLFEQGALLEDIDASLDSLAETIELLQEDYPVASVSPTSRDWARTITQLDKQLERAVERQGLENTPGYKRWVQAFINSLEINDQIAGANDVVFDQSQGTFISWQGDTTASSLNLPADWQAGHEIPGYTATEVAPGVYRYTANDGAAVATLPQQFVLDTQGQPADDPAIINADLASVMADYQEAAPGLETFEQHVDWFAEQFELLESSYHHTSAEALANHLVEAVNTAIQQGVITESASIRVSRVIAGQHSRESGG